MVARHLSPTNDGSDRPGTRTLAEAAIAAGASRTLRRHAFRRERLRVAADSVVQE